MHQGMYGCYIDHKKKLFKKCVSDKINFFRSWRKERISILLEFYFPAEANWELLIFIYLLGLVLGSQIAWQNVLLF